MERVRATMGHRFSEAIHAIFLRTWIERNGASKLALSTNVTNTYG